MVPAIALNDAVLREIAKATEVGQFLWQREWAERNGGNLSIDLTDLLPDVSAQTATSVLQPVADLPRTAAGQLYFMKGSGERMRDLVRPHEAGCIIRIDDLATGYQVMWGGRGRADYRPTSELLSHIKLLLDARHRASTDRCVVHTHPHELIMLSHHPVLGQDPSAYNLACWKMLPEVRAFVPRGVRLVPYLRSGSVALSDATVIALQTADVAMWEKHGAVAMGPDALSAFDLIDVANKGAKLYLGCLASGFEPAGLSDGQLAELAAVFDLPAARF